MHTSRFKPVPTLAAAALIMALGAPAPSAAAPPATSHGQTSTASREFALRQAMKAMDSARATRNVTGVIQVCL